MQVRLAFSLIARDNTKKGRFDMYKILIVEDDAAITAVLTRQLTSWGYAVETVQDFSAVLEQFETFEPHLVLMDLSLPLYNGYHWCTEIRKTSKTPVLFISSAGDDMNLVMALNLGADDFIAKPFHLDVVTAKIQAILRRTYAFGADASLLALGDVSLNLGDCTLCRNSEKLELTKNEFRILQQLMEAQGNIVSREAIIRSLWESENFVDDNTLTVNVTRLRRKLEELNLGDFIRTKKGIGYWVEVPT